MTTSTIIKKLDDAQLLDFDQEYMRGEKLQKFMRLIHRDFPDGRLSVLDIGGGNGRFLDTLLDQFPNAQATLLDNAEVLVALNKPNPRKTLICDSVENLESHIRGPRFDLICFNFVLHHFVGPSYQASRRFQGEMLAKVRDYLLPRGRIWVLEDIYHGLVFPGLPSRLIHFATSSRTLRPLARKMGANTAGVGVCFLNRHQWEKTFRGAHLEVLEYHPYSAKRVDLLRRVGLHVGSMRAGHFWLKSERNDPVLHNM
jgi:hypothetical protein